VNSSVIQRGLVDIFNWKALGLQEGKKAEERMGMDQTPPPLPPPHTHNNFLMDSRGKTWPNQVKSGRMKVAIFFSFFSTAHFLQTVGGIEKGGCTKERFINKIKVQ
jgi:hypothetical protein